MLLMFTDSNARNANNYNNNNNNTNNVATRHIFPKSPRSCGQRAKRRIWTSGSMAL